MSECEARDDIECKKKQKLSTNSTILTSQFTTNSLFSKQKCITNNLLKNDRVKSS